MSNRKLVVLGVVAALMAAWAVIQSYVSKSKAPARLPLKESYLIQGLDPAKIAGVVMGKSDNPVRLIRQGERFLVTNKDNYPALTGKINDLITSCLDIETIEVITDNPANHESLSVTEEKAQNIVKFLDKDEMVITGVIVGTSRLGENLQMDTRNTYVRLVSDDTVYLARDVPLATWSSMNFIDKELVSVNRSDIREVTVTTPEESYTLKVEDSNDDTIILENKPPDRELKKSDCRQVFTALMSLTFTDVKKESAEAGAFQFDRTYVCRLKESRVYTLQIAKAHDKTYIKCSAKYTGEIPKKDRRVESEEELKKKEAKLLAYEQTVSFTEKCQGWIYEIDDWKAQNLTRNTADLFEEQKKDQEQEQEKQEKVGLEDKQQQSKTEQPKEKQEQKQDEQTDESSSDSDADTSKTKQQK